MKWRVEGADANTGEPREVIVEAETERAAIEQARQRGIFTTRIVQVVDATNDRLQAVKSSVARELSPAYWKAREDEFQAKRRAVVEEKRKSQRQKVEMGKHVQWVRLTGSSEFSLVFCVAIGVFLGLTAFSCIGGILGLAGLAAGVAGAAGGATPGP